jgi:hypothetical protein
VPVEEFEAIGRYDDWCEWSESYAGGWQVGQWVGTDLIEAVDPLLRDVVAGTGSPALVGFVLDSDFVAVHARADEGSPGWRACLCRSGARAYLEDRSSLESVYLEPGEAAERATGWATTAGLAAAPEALSALFHLDGRDRPAETLFFDLVHALGIADDSEG